MISNGDDKLSVIGDPGALSQGLVYKEQCLIGYGCAVKAELCRHDAFLGGGTVYCSVCGRSELNSVLFVKNNRVNSVGKIRAFDSVQNNASYGDLTEEGLAL